MIVALTEKGVTYVDEVIRMCFAYLNMMRQGDGPPLHIHEDKRDMSDVNFQFMQRAPALATAKLKANLIGLWAMT